MKKSRSYHVSAKRPPPGSAESASSPSLHTAPPGYVMIAAIPGLARLLPGTHDPHNVIESAYGRWKLPIRYRGRDVALYRDGTLLARC